VFVPKSGPAFTREQLLKAVGESQTWADVLRRLGYCPTGGNRNTVKKYAAKWSISADHFDPDAARRRALRRAAAPLGEILVENSTYSRGTLKKRLYAECLKERRCERCGQGEIWRGRRMALILDHINGVRDDNRLENLQIVCPNCAATLPTHCGRGLRKPRETRSCSGCGRDFIPRFRAQKYCSRACGQRAGRIPRRGHAQHRLRKVKRPPYEQLRAEIEATNWSAVARKYGVSDTAVRKWMRWYEQGQVDDMGA
jgi:ferredoxin